MGEQSPDPHEEQVRRLLADARHTGPVPPDVAARLDRVLADLAAERAGEAASDTSDTSDGIGVADLASRRRRRVTALLVAAAAVVAVGVGVDRLTTHSSGGGSASQTTADSVRPGQHGAPRDRKGAGSSPSAGSGSASAQGLSPEKGLLDLAGVVPARVRADHFTTDAARARHLASAPADTVSDSPQGGTGSTSASPPESRATFVCERGDWGRGRVVAVRYGGLPAVLVLRPPQGETQVVDLFRCGTSEVLRSTTLPVH